MFKNRFIYLIAAAFAFIWAAGGFLSGGLWLSSVCFFAAGILFIVRFFKNSEKQ
ncbi:MAG: hypothetical protein IJA92_05765 [Oscillospiraceae bacterium]|nr:hypothetical protein [Oscillospiraceae bacterium]